MLQIVLTWYAHLARGWPCLVAAGGAPRECRLLGSQVCGEEFAERFATVQNCILRWPTPGPSCLLGHNRFSLLERNTMFTMFLSIWIWSLKVNAWTASGLMFCSKLTIISSRKLAVLSYFTVTTDHLVVFSPNVAGSAERHRLRKCRGPGSGEESSSESSGVESG